MNYRVAFWTIFLVLLVVDIRANTAYESPLSGSNKVDWFISDFMDHGDGMVPRDYHGGFQSYVGHGGTDILLYDFKTMADGVDVLASAPGTVTFTLDGFFDMQTGELISYLPGNYLTVRHADNSEAMYYHFKRGSILVTNGQTVVTGQKLGEVGCSGFAAYPHVHFQVFAGDETVEIMTGQAGQVQSFDWFDSYSNQVRMQVVGMGTTVTNDSFYANMYHHTPRSYSVMAAAISAGVTAAPPCPAPPEAPQPQPAEEHPYPLLPNARWRRAPRCPS